MPKVNLLPREDLDKKAIGKFLKWILSYGRYIIITVELVVFLVFFSRFIYDRQLADLRDEITQKQAIVASASDFEKKIRSIHHRIDQAKSLDKSRLEYLTILHTLEQLTPQDITFHEILLKEATLSLTGSALTNESFAKFLLNLKSTEKLSNVSLDEVGRDEETGLLLFQTTMTIPELATIYATN